MTHRLFFILISICTITRSFSQIIDEKKFHHYGTRDGLSDSKITGLAQDATGYIWIATSHGLNRFDGVNFRQFLQSSEHNPIPDNEIFSMQQLPGDELAIATNDGAQIISCATLAAKDLDVPAPEELRYWSNFCLYVHRDADHNYGLSTRTGFYIFSPDGQLKKRYDHYTEKNIGHAWMLFGNHIFKLPDGNLLQENSVGAWEYDRKKNFIGEAYNDWPGLRQIFKPKEHRPRFFSIAENKMLVFDPQKNSFDILDIRNGNIQSSPASFNVQDEVNWKSKLSHIYSDHWAITSSTNGFYLFSIDTVLWKISCDSTKYFADQFCSQVFCDNKKRFLVGTNDGFFMEDINPAIITSFPVPAKNTSNFSVTGLLIGTDKIFAGTDSKEIFILDKQTHQLLKQLSFKKWPGRVNEISSMMFVAPDTLWVVSTTELLWVNTNNFTHGVLMQDYFDSTTDFLNLFRDKKRNIWIICNRLNTVFYFDPAKKIEKITDHTETLFRVNSLSSIAEDKYDNIWIGGDAIARWNAATKKIDTLIEHLPGQKNRKRGYVVMSDAEGNIWTTINDEGIAKITGANIHLQPGNLSQDHSVDLRPGLYDDKIFLATNNAIGYLDLHNLKSTILDNDDGMPREHISSYHLSHDDADRSTWFACKKMICRISPDINPSSSSSPVLKISDLSVQNDRFINYPPASVSLKYFQNNVRIALSTINFPGARDMRFAYRLMNKKDTNWIEAGAQPLILLTNISPGDYNIEIKLYSYNNKWPEQTTSIDIDILPPFWETWWFFSLVAIVVTTGVYIVYKRRVKKIKEKANIDRQLTEYEMKALHAQMNPHFIFNCLNSIREMILNNENSHASHYLSKFAQLIRITLNNSSKPFVSLNNNIDYLQRYLEMEKIRNPCFSYTIEVDEQLQPDELMMPPMLLQPFLENAIWHGVSPGKELILDIRFLKKDQQLVCVVDDNGIGIETSIRNKNEMANNPIGIANVKERIKVLNEKYNLQSSITIEDKSNLAINNGTGTTVRLYFPLKPVQS